MPIAQASKGRQASIFMLLTREQVEYVALLGRLKLTETEQKQYTAQLNSILEHARILDKLDTADVEPMAHVLPLNNVFRDDKAGACLDRELALQNAPDRVAGLFKVPRIV